MAFSNHFQFFFKFSLLLLQFGQVLSQTPEKFIVKIAPHYFPQCNLFFLRQGQNNINKNDHWHSFMLTEIVRQTETENMAYYNYMVDYDKRNNSDISLSLPTPFPITMNTFNRMAPRCKIAIMLLNDLEDEFLTAIKKLVTFLLCISSVGSCY